MSGWLNMHNLIVFLLGVLLASYVKMLVSQVKGKVGG